MNLKTQDNHYKFKVYLSFSETRNNRWAKYINDYLKPAFLENNIGYYDFREHERFDFLNVPAVCGLVDKNLANSDIFLRFIGEDLEPNKIYLVDDLSENIIYNPYTRNESQIPDYAEYEVDTSYDKFGFTNPYNRFQIVSTENMVGAMNHISSIYYTSFESDQDFTQRVINELSAGYQEQQYLKRSNLLFYFEEHFEKARVLFEQKKYDEAIIEYEAAILNNPHFDDAYTECADVFMLINDYENAVSNLHSAIKINPKNAKAHNNLGCCYLQLGDKKQAESEFNKAAELDDKYKPNQGTSESTRPMKAVKSFSEDKTLEGDYCDNQGVKLQKQKKYHEAIILHEKAIKLGTTYHAITYNNLGRGYYNIGNFDQAMYYYDKALEIEPNYSLALKNRELAVNKKAAAL
jgi:tetratricopeptide (TPR) repeat protein